MDKSPGPSSPFAVRVLRFKPRTIRPAAPSPSTAPSPPENSNLARLRDEIAREGRNVRLEPTHGGWCLMDGHQRIATIERISGLPIVNLAGEMIPLVPDYLPELARRAARSFVDTSSTESRHGELEDTVALARQLFSLSLRRDDEL